MRIFRERLREGAKGKAAAWRWRGPAEGGMGYRIRKPRSMRLLPFVSWVGGLKTRKNTRETIGGRALIIRVDLTGFTRDLIRDLKEECRGP